jgi:hypothetical protein
MITSTTASEIAKPVTERLPRVRIKPGHRAGGGGLASIAVACHFLLPGKNAFSPGQGLAPVFRRL